MMKNDEKPSYKLRVILKDNVDHKQAMEIATLMVNNINVVKVLCEETKVVDMVSSK